MVVETASLIIEIVQIYFWIGLGVAALFLIIGIDRVEPGARGSYVFRALLIPGCIVLWPLVLVRWLALERARSS